MNKEFKIRSMTFADLELVLTWADREGWNPGLKDAVAFYATDPGGFLIGEIEGEPISCIASVRYGDIYGNIGLYIVTPSWRGQGFGLKTWEEGWKLLNRHHVTLDAVLTQLENYSKFGFKPAYRHIRYEGINIVSKVATNNISLTSIPFPQVLDYDRLHFPASRPAFLQEWIRPFGGAGYGFVKSNKLCGYGVIRPASQGWRIGPLFADNSFVAESLLSSLINYAQDQPVFIDIPDINPEAISLVKKYGMNPIFECVYMYNHTLPDIRINQVFGVTTLELG